MEPRRLSPATVALLVLGFLLLRATLFAFTTAGECNLYRRYAEAIRESSFTQLYRDVDVEYPPLAVLFGVPVAHLADQLPEGAERLTALRPNESWGAAGARYEVALGVALFAVDVACLVLVGFVARRAYPEEGPRALAVRMGLYVAATTACGLILYDRQDLVVGLFPLLALAAFARGWSVAAYAALTVGTAYKLVPVLLVPLFVLAFAAARSAPAATPRRFLVEVARQGLVAGVVLAMYPLLSYLLWGERSFVYLTFHSARGLQLEAPATWLVFLLDRDTRVGYGYFCFTLRGSLADRVAALSTPAVVLAAGLSVLAAARGFWRMASAPEPAPRNALVTHLAIGSLLVWVGFILFTKVGSPQYLLWPAVLLPFLPLRGAGLWSVLVLLAAGVFTTLVFPCQYKAVAGEGAHDGGTSPGPNALGMVLLAGKSLSLAVAFLLLAAVVWRRVPAPAPPPEAS